MKTRPLNEQPKQHKRAKNFYSGDKHKALDDICKKTGLPPTSFKEGEHTDKTFVYVEK